MYIDHIFIFSTNEGQEAEELVEFGFKEGSGRSHPGQGTTNRKFYFQNFFLEILWVHDPNEIQSSRTSITGLWDRSNYSLNNCSPFGLCLGDLKGGEESIFKDSNEYQPEYFSEGMSIDFVSNDTWLPWVFRLPFERSPTDKAEPTNHSFGIQKLTSALFYVPSVSESDPFLNCFSDSPIHFKESNTHSMTLEFDNHRCQSSYQFESLPLRIKY